MYFAREKIAVIVGVVVIVVVIVAVIAVVIVAETVAVIAVAIVVLIVAVIVAVVVVAVFVCRENRAADKAIAASATAATGKPDRKLAKEEKAEEGRSC